jgi:hypothetical protein
MKRAHQDNYPKPIHLRSIYIPFNNLKPAKWNFCGFYELKKQDSLLPRALLVAIGLQTLFALVLVHLETAFLFEVTHVVSGLN